MSILGLAKKAASASAGFVWKSSGAANVPILEGGRKMLGGIGSKFKSEDGVGKDSTEKSPCLFLTMLLGFSVSRARTWFSLTNVLETLCKWSFRWLLIFL